MLQRSRWILRIVLVWAVVLLLRPPSSRAPLMEQQAVETTKPYVCVHTLLENEVFEWKIQRSLELVRQMGAGTIVQFFPWAHFEPQDNHYTWNQADLIVRHARNQGLRIIARLGFVPAWARSDPQDSLTTLNYLPDEAFADFADFAATFAGRYADAIYHIIIWNEPNLSFEWGYRPVDAAAYARLLEVSYPRIKQANPNALDAVRLGHADAALVDATSYRLYRREHPNWRSQSRYVTHDGYAIALLIDRADAWKLVNHALTALKESHELDTIIADWL